MPAASVRGEHGGALEAVHDDGVGGREADELLEALGDLGELGGCGRRWTARRRRAGSRRGAGGGR